MDLRNCTKQELSQMPYEYVCEAYYQHNPNAVWILGVFFRHGKNGAPQNYEKARQLLEIAYEYEGAGSGFILGNIYEEGLGTTVDLKKAEDYYCAFSEETHDPTGYSAAAFLYLKNENLPNRDEKIPEYLKKSEALGGCPLSDTLIGQLYIAGTPDFPKDINKAVFYLERSKNYKILGDLFSDEKSIEPNYKLASYYYELGMSDNMDCCAKYAFLNLYYGSINESWTNVPKGISVAKKYLKTNNNYESSFFILKAMFLFFDKAKNIEGLELCTDYLYIIGECNSDSEDKNQLYYSIIDSLSDLYINENPTDKLDGLLSKLSKMTDAYPQIAEITFYLEGLLCYKHGIFCLNINEISMAYDSFDSAYKLGFEDAKKFLIRFKRDIFGKLKFR